MSHDTVTWGTSLTSQSRMPSAQSPRLLALGCWHISKLTSSFVIATSVQLEIVSVRIITSSSASRVAFYCQNSKLNKRTTNKMAFLAGLYRYRQFSSLPIQLNYSYSWSWCHHCPYPSYTTNRWLSSSESIRTEFPVENAYDILEVAETSSFAEIKASFRKLAKETHPDLVDSKNDSSASKHFVRILAAYEVLCVLAFFFSLSESH